jgi:ATP-dependent Lon protease
MSLLELIPIVGFTGMILIIINENDNKRKEEMKKHINKMKKMRKDMQKQVFIRKFIDEIPDLSYYEAMQLNNKLKQIYLEWNDE